jgi:hypothetical protein
MTRRLLDAFRNMGPYVALELFVPGGTLLSILLWYARRRRALAAARQA